MSHNIGTLENVTLRSDDGAGVCGLDLNAREPGPSFVRGLQVEGFDIGIRSNQTAFSMTFEDLTLRKQRVVGMLAEAQCFFVRKLDAELSVPVFHNKGPYGSGLFYDCSFVGSGPAAIITDNAQLVLRNVSQRGYQSLVDCTFEGGADLNEAVLAGDWSPRVGGQVSAFGDHSGPLNLPVEEIPDTPWGAPGSWEVVDGDALLAAWDDADLVQEAIDRAAKKGRATVCIPNLPGTAVRFGRTIRVHGSVQRLIGMHTWMQVTPWFAKQDEPIFRIENGKGPVVLERMFFQDYAGARHESRCYLIDHASKRTLVLRNIGMWGHHPYRNSVTGGKVFIDDTTSQGYVFRDQQVWMRQFNPESNAVMATVDGGSLWVFGSKTECETGTWFHLKGGAQMELLGGYNYPSWRNKNSPAPKPLFVVEEGSRLWASYREQIFHGYMDYPVQVREVRGADTRDLGHAARSGHHFYSVVQAGKE
jgi:hypothetical protein